MTTTLATIADQIEGTDVNLFVFTTSEGWVDVHTADRGEDGDFVRLVNDDGMVRAIHLTHNEVIRGEASFNNSFVPMVAGVVSAMLAI